MTRDRLTCWGRVCAALAVGGAVLSTAYFVSAGVPLVGGDFLQFWAGAKLAAQGEAARAYDPAFFRHFMATFVNGTPVPHLYSYPPTATLLWLPLAYLPFKAALSLWLVTGIGICGVLLARTLGREAAILLSLGAPAAVVDSMQGQTGHLTATLFAGGLMLIERRPVVAGILLGAMCYKPHLGVLIPLALIAGCEWRAFLAAAATVAAMVGGSFALFGANAWLGWLDPQLTVQTHFLATESSWPRAMPSVYGTAIQIFAASRASAYLLQAISALAATAVVTALWRSEASRERKTAGLVIALFLATPYFWNYDEVLLIFAAAWIAAEGIARGFRPGDRLIAVALLAVPAAFIVGLAWVVPVVLWMALLTFVCAGAAIDPGAKGRQGSTPPAAATPLSR